MEIRYATISKTGRRHNNEDAYKVIDMPQNNRFMGIHYCPRKNINNCSNHL